MIRECMRERVKEGGRERVRECERERIREGGIAKIQIIQVRVSSI